MVCSHFSPSSVIHAYAKDLEDLRVVVTQCGVDTDVHICVDAQTGLGTWPPRPYSGNIVIATIVSHRAAKQRLLENFIMENMLTATNTFHFEKDGANNNLYTCNYNGKHEPQQIDYILSLDNSLRSNTFDSPATNSDHWGLTATMKSSHAKVPRKRKNGKPIGWQCRERVKYNNEVHLHESKCEHEDGRFGLGAML